MTADATINDIPNTPEGVAELHRRLDALETRIARREQATGDAAAVLLVTADVPDYPTTARAAFPCHRARPTGEPAEGSEASIEVDTSEVLFAENVGGSKVPPPGVLVIATRVDGALVFVYH